MWKEYELKLFDFLKEIYPKCEIEYDDSIFGIYSNVERQIDFAIRGNLAGKRILGIVDCKYYNKNINVKIIESFIGMMQDVNANFGFMITNQGYSQAAKNRVKNSNLKLDVLKFNELNEIELTLDYFFNQNIKGLQLSKSEFFKRNKQNTGYFDVEKSNYKKRVIYYREGFANTEYFAFKKLLENSVRAFRDFELLQDISLFIPANKCDSSTNFADKKYLYSCKITKYEIEKFLNTNIDYLRDDIINWRTDFIDKISKDIIMNFANLYIKQTELQIS
ncbi:restriction endonuclease [Chishuiella sp.]|uniref:restriction endonuclease n=1 Tax=Chishuiella sp. TaxID=1969467 RepID=UPI0028B0E851|nr:restriction endonuclease [Chishuiella sp.]